MAFTKPLRLTVDITSRKLVAYNGTPTAIGSLFQSNQLLLEIQTVDPTGTVGTGASYTVVDFSGFGLRVSVGSQPTGASGGPTPLALQTSFTWDTTRKLFTGTLALNTASVDSYIGSIDQKEAWFEINLTDGADRFTLLQDRFTIKAVVDEGSSTVPTPTDQFYTKNEADGRFHPRSGSTAYYLTNTTTGKSMILYLGDDDAFHAELVT